MKINWDKKIACAPMEDVTDFAFRSMVRKYKADLVWTYMLPADGIVHKNPKFINELEIIAKEKNIVVQLFGSDVKIMAKAAEIVENISKPLAIDINAGCPSKHITTANMGAALLKTPSKLGKIIDAMKNSVSIPVLLKIRSGWDSNNKNYMKVLTIAENAGVDALTIHPRTKEQNYSGKADWNIIKEIKEKAKVPIIGNGDITTPEKAKAMFEYTNCDAIMIGRAAMHNPKIFLQIKQYLKNKSYDPITTKDRIEFCKEYIQLALKHTTKFNNIKLHCLLFLREIPKAASLRNNISKAKSTNEILSELETLESEQVY